MRFDEPDSVGLIRHELGHAGAALWLGNSTARVQIMHYDNNGESGLQTFSNDDQNFTRLGHVLFALGGPLADAAAWLARTHPGVNEAELARRHLDLLYSKDAPTVSLAWGVSERSTHDWRTLTQLRVTGSERYDAYKATTSWLYRLARTQTPTLEHLAERMERLSHGQSIEFSVAELHALVFENQGSAGRVVTASLRTSTLIAVPMH